MSFKQLTDIALKEECLSHEQCLQVLSCPDDEILALVDAAYKVRRHFFQKCVNIQVLSNAKSGLCSEDCTYCSQSRISDAPIEKYSLVSKDKLLGEARDAKNLGAKRFCMALADANLPKTS